MKVVVCASLGIFLILTSISDATVDLNTAVGMWLFDEGSGNIAKDSSGNGNDGQLTNGQKWVQGSGDSSAQLAIYEIKEI